MLPFFYLHAMIRQLLIMLLFITSPLLSFSKGAGGVYYITGKASAAHRVLANQPLTIKFNNNTWTVLTDREGYFRIAVPWSTACPSGITALRRKRLNKRMNPKWIIVQYEQYEVKLQNDWKKYARRSFADEEESIRKKDLHFE